MGGARGHFPTGSNVTRPFSNWIKMALLVFASQQGNMHMGGTATPEPMRERYNRLGQINMC